MILASLSNVTIQYPREGIDNLTHWNALKLEFRCQFSKSTKVQLPVDPFASVHACVQHTIAQRETEKGWWCVQSVVNQSLVSFSLLYGKIQANCRK